MPVHRLACSAVLLLSLSLFAAGQSIQLHVDLTDAPRNIYHVRLLVPAKPGQMTLVYPKWIPGNHRPSGPIANLTGLHVKIDGQELPWRRDGLDMYAFHFDVPTGAKEVQVNLDTLTTDSAGAGGSAASSNLLDLNWNQVVLYPLGVG